MISADIGVPTPLELMLYDGATSKGVRARIRSTSGILITTVNLLHIGDGLYTAYWTPSDGGYFHATYIVYTDGAYSTEDLAYIRTTSPYRVTLPGGLDPVVFSNAIWNALLANHSEPGSFGEAVGQILINSDPSTIATNVWDVIATDHQIPNTFGDYVGAIRQYCIDIFDELTHPIWGMDMLYSLNQTNAATIVSEINQNETKIDSLVPLITGVEANLANKIEANKILLEAMSVQNEVNTNEVLDAISFNGDKIDVVGSLISTLQNNTTTRFVVPERLVKPTTGTKNYEFHLRLYDSTGNPEAPDGAPKIRIRRLDSGVDIVLDAAMTQDGAKVGAYYYVFSISAGTNEYPALVEATIKENGAIRFVPALTEITEFESDLNAIQAQLSTVDSKVTTTNTQLSNPTYGLAALKTGENDIIYSLGLQDAKLTSIKSKTDSLPANIATTTDISSVLVAISAKPNLSDIQGELDYLKDSIMGPDLRNLTDVYNKWDISSLAKTNDPRFNYLDAAISSRSNINAHDIWTYGTRTLSNFTLPEASVKSIWDYLCSQATTIGSFGKRIASNLDATVSSRATAIEVHDLLDGVAQESTLVAARDDILSSLTDCKNKLNNITAKVIAIQSKTQYIPVDPATTSGLSAVSMQIRDDIATVDAKMDLVVEDVNRIPPDPARQSSVLAIPTNPLLTTDARLANLDARISTRSTLTSIDLASIAKKADVTAAKNEIVSEIEINRDRIDGVKTDTVYTKVDTDRIPLDPATLASISAAEAAILDAISHISGGGSGGGTIDPAAIWSYPTRTITQDPASFGPDISNLATKADVAAITGVSQYTNRMTTTFNTTTGDQEVLAWAEKDGQRVPSSSDCTIIIKDTFGLTKWTQSSSVPNADGVYRFINPTIVSSDANYYVVLVIKVDGDFKTSQQAFITIG